MKHFLLKTLISVPPMAAIGFAILLAPEVAKAASPGSDTGVISGTVKNSTNDQPIENAILVLQCPCLSAQQERMTNARGIYAFQALPTGNYTIRVLAGKANDSRTTRLANGARFRADFALDPKRGQANGDEASRP